MVLHFLARARHVAAAVLLICATTSACAAGGATESTGGVGIAFFPNLAHAPAILGVENGLFEKRLDGAKVQSQVVSAGPDAITALLSGKVDMAFLGPAPAATAFAKSGGEVSLISGVSSGGVRFLASPRVAKGPDLAGTSIADPALGGTLDVALRHWLTEHGYDVDGDGSDAVKVLPQDPGQVVGAYASGSIDGAWMHEPYATLMESKGAVQVLDERDLWPGGRFANTVLVVRNDFLTDHPDQVEAILEGLLAGIDAVRADPSGSRSTVARFITDQTGLELSEDELTKAWSSIDFTSDPLPSTIQTQLERAAALGLQDEPDLDGFVEMEPLRQAKHAHATGGQEQP